MASSAEREMRDALVAWFHANEPKARIVHELNVSGQGSNRADLGVVFSDTLFLIEIKSERDKLTRLKDQFDAFIKVSHGVVIAAHECHFDGDGLKGCDWMRWSHRDHLWRYPAPAAGWDLKRYANYGEPHALVFLHMLWVAELREECERHGIIAGGGQQWQLAHALTLGLTGRQIREAVCRQLRKRAFAEADAPLVDQIAA